MKVQSQILVLALVPSSPPTYLFGERMQKASGEKGSYTRKRTKRTKKCLFSDSLPSKPVPSFFILSCHVGLSSQIESCFPNWPVKRFCHAEIIPRAKSGNLRQPGNRTAGRNAACNKRHCE